MGKYLRYIDVRIAEYDFSNNKNDTTMLMKNANEIKWFFDKQYEYYFNHGTKVLSDGIAKVNIMLTYNSSNDYMISDLNLEVVDIHRYFDIEKYMLLINSEKNKYCLDIINDSLFAIFKNNEEVKTQLISIYKTILNNDYKLAQYWKKTVVSPDRTMKAQIYFILHETLDQYVHIFDMSGNVIQKKLLGKLRPQYINFGLLSWGDITTIYLYEIMLSKCAINDDANKRDYWAYNIVNDTLTFYFDRAEKGQAHGQYELGKMYLNGWDKQCPDIEKALYWFKKSAEQGYSRAITILNKIS